MKVLGFFAASLLLLTFVYSSGAEIQKNNLESSSYGCVCANYTCGCCAHVEAPRVGLNDTGCVNLTYLPNEYGISFTVTIDNLTIYNETVSARNPPPMCFGAPILKEYADLCIHFYDLSVSKTKMHGCAQLEARLHRVVVGTYKLGCFQIGNLRWKQYHKDLINHIIMRQHIVTLD
ncbi:DUF4773 domain-containing protein [Trichonephila clavipes]|uniref:DUF4773 domain-containing protein n=1 Tax=Trichonephila clavipes TaxID=2585209 RepID=A0A8X6V5D4_TRICX|nr:DUF4773 domain-containing protein [Trichonephila clavipes]